MVHVLKSRWTMVVVALAVALFVVAVVFARRDRIAAPPGPENVVSPWKQAVVPAAATQVPLHAISSGSDASYAVGERGLILRKAGRDGTWEVESSTTDRRLTAIALRGEEAIAAGDSVIVERAANGTWKSITSADLPVFRAASYSWMGPILVGDGGAIYLKGPSGWKPETTRSRATLRGVCTGLTEVIAVGDDGTVLRWIKGTWSLELSGTHEDLDAIVCDDRQAIAVGRKGIILERKDASWHMARTQGPPESRLFAVAAPFGLGSFLAVGEKGIVVRSVGVERTTIASDLYGVTVGPQGELAVGMEGLFFRAN